MNNHELEKKARVASGQLVSEKGYVCAVDLFMRLGYLTQKDYELWRTGKVEYLERVCKANLKKLSLISKTMRIFGRQSKLKPSKTAYMTWGKGKKRPLKFSKSGRRNIEEAYATHWVLSKKK